MRTSWLIKFVGPLALFTGLTLVLLYPLSINLAHMVPEPTDPLLNAWRMQWNARAFLSGWDGLTNLYNTNIFYPYPLTLLFSEHFLMPTALSLPLLLLFDSHLVGMNAGVLLTFVLSGYAMYLLVLNWTGSRWAGVIAGILFAFSPHRFGQLNHLELLTTQWMPLTLLALHWTLTRRAWRYPLLFALFFNLQALSGFHFTLNLTLACLLLTLIYALFGRIDWRGSLWVAGGGSVAVTVLLNSPIWWGYLTFSELMGAVRTPGEVRVYSAALTDYVTTLPHNWLYGWTFGRWQSAEHQFQPLMPVGVVGGLLALAGVVAFAIHKKLSTLRPTIVFWVLLMLTGLILSFGLNENALGSDLAPLLESVSPYPWLYDNVQVFQGIRVPGRFGILVVLGVVGLAAWGLALLHNLTPSILPLLRGGSSLPHTGEGLGKGAILSLMVAGLILVEVWSVPLIGPEFPAGDGIPPVYGWLRTETPADAVIVELPHDGPSEFLYEYYSSHHWRRMANGGTGYTPPIYREMRKWFDAFPDPRSVDVMQQLGLDYVILHQNAYTPDEWQSLQAELPRYLPAIESIRTIGEAHVLHLREPTCPPQPDRVAPYFDPLDGNLQVSYHNDGAAAFVGDVHRPSFTHPYSLRFLEPLVTPAGDVQSVLIPDVAETLLLVIAAPEVSPTASLRSFGDTVMRSSDTRPLYTPSLPPDWHPFALTFADGPTLTGYSLIQTSATPCSLMTASLQWQVGQPDDRVTVHLLDPFGRVVAGQTTPLAEVNHHLVPLPGSLPPGQYGLRVYVYDENGRERLPITEDGVTIPTAQIPPLPVTIHPMALETDADVQATFGGQIQYLGGDILLQNEWLRFTLMWQTESPIEQDLTVFTQLIGPDGQVWAQHDNPPKGGWYHTTLWQPDQAITDDYAFPIPADAPPGDYQLIAGWYDPTTLARLTTDTGQDFVTVTTIRIEP